MFVGITQLGSVKDLPYLASNVLSIFTVLPLSIAVLAAGFMWPVLLKSLAFRYSGCVAYEIYLVHAFTLVLIRQNVAGVILFIIATLVLVVTLHLAIGLKIRIVIIRGR